MLSELKVTACSVVEFSHQEAGHAAGGGHIPWRRHSTLQLLSHLSPTELRAVYSVPAASNTDDLKLFARYRLLVISETHFLCFVLFDWSSFPAYFRLAESRKQNPLGITGAVFYRMDASIPQIDIIGVGDDNMFADNR